MAGSLKPVGAAAQVLKSKPVAAKPIQAKPKPENLNALMSNNKKVQMVQKVKDDERQKDVVIRKVKKQVPVEKKVRNVKPEVVADEGEDFFQVEDDIVGD